MVPALHSLQYLAVVWRYQLGYERDRPGASDALGSVLPSSVATKKYHLNMALFVVLGMVLGAIGFWAIPIFLQVVVNYDTGRKIGSRRAGGVGAVFYFERNA